MNRVARTFVVALSLTPLVVTAAPRGALADEHDPHLERKRRAYALIQEGSARFDLGKFDEAIDLFQKAYEVYPYPEALFSIAQAHRMKKDYERAVFFYKSYLRNHEAAPNRATVEARIADLERLIAQQKTSAQEPPQGVQPPPAPPGGAAGPAPATAPAASRPPSDVPAWYEDGWAWTLVGGGLVGLGGGLWLVDASNDREYAHLPADDQLRVDEDRANRYKKIGGWSAVGLGGAALVLGVVKLVGTDAPRAPSADVALVLGAGYLGVAGTF